MKIRFAYTGIQVKAMDRALAFYKAILNMDVVLRKKVKQTHGEMCVLRSGRNYLELNQYFGKSFEPGGTLDHLAFEVSTLEGFVKEMKRSKIKTRDYLETKNWKRCFIEDPDGNEIEVYQRLKVRPLKSKKSLNPK